MKKIALLLPVLVWVARLGMYFGYLPPLRPGAAEELGIMLLHCMSLAAFAVLPGREKQDMKQ